MSPLQAPGKARNSDDPTSVMDKYMYIHRLYLLKLNIMIVYLILCTCSRITAVCVFMCVCVCVFYQATSYAIV